MTQAIVFLGPTLPVADARQILAADYRPPAAQGDLWRAAQARPAAIGLIDGLFERVPSVWHKEILWALSDGIRVYGAASVGALRAVELGPYGMIGVGRIYEAYRDGALTDDDAVAVAHGTEEHGYRALSDALVNLRASWLRAEAERVITGRTRQVLERVAQGLFYPERTLLRVLAGAREDGVTAEEHDALMAWWPEHAVDQKREDALALLRLMRAHATTPPPPLKPVTFEETTWWREVVERQKAGHGP
jgi:hypothetical protein